MAKNRKTKPVVVNPQKPVTKTGPRNLPKGHFLKNKRTARIYSAHA